MMMFYLFALRLIVVILCIEGIISGSFDSAGRLQQVEFAQKAVEKGRGLVAVKTLDGILVATIRSKDSSNIFSKPIETGLKQIYNGPYFLGTGLVSDVHYLRQQCFQHCTEHLSTYGTLPNIHKLGAHLSELAYERSLSNEERPLGASCLLLQCVPNTTQTQPSATSSSPVTAKILEIDVTGQCHDCVMSCVGGLGVGELVKQWPASDPPPTLLTLDDAKQKVMALLRQVISQTDSTMDDVDCTFCYVDNENKMREITKSLV